MNKTAHDEAGAFFDIDDPLGKPIRIPTDVTADFAYFQPADSSGIAAYYAAEGYFVVRGLVPPELCDAAHAAFEREVKPYPGFIYRQATANPERHVFTDTGHMLNSILNVQSLHPRHFPEFRRLGTEVLTHPRVQQVVDALFGEPGKIVQTMYFEGNPATWPHQDTYYLDSENIGALCAAWIAVEDIAPGAGRFFIYPKSHLIDMARNGGSFDVAFNHDRYKELVRRIIDEHGMECRAPALAKGDALFWHAKTIHGSLETTQPQRSRRSFTAHYIPQSHRFLQFQHRIKPLALREANGMQVHFPKDLAKARNRSIFAVETHFPRTFRTVKKVAIKAVTR